MGLHYVTDPRCAVKQVDAHVVVTKPREDICLRRVSVQLDGSGRIILAWALLHSLSSDIAIPDHRHVTTVGTASVFEHFSHAFAIYFEV